MGPKEEKNKSSVPGAERPIVIDSWARVLVLFALALGLGLLAINQGLGYMYKVHLLKAPCDICSELNPGVQTCIDNLNKPRASYWVGDEGEGHWTDPFNNSYYEINLSDIPY